ncbi:MAG: SRPBCC family protein [Pyrinomonadaceae bacterium]|nr:SRPBCC family protein [Pyrinomonadaceae bacterium]
MIKNTHERIIHAQVSEVGSLIDGLASRDDALWPATNWPPMRFDRPLRVGAVGGHGPIRYFIESYEPSRSITFRFTAPKGFIGTHGLAVEEIAPNVVRLRHVLTMRVKGLARLSWPLAFRWLHDALVEDALDRAEAHFASKPLNKNRWSLWVRLLRRLMSPRKAVVAARKDGMATARK